MSAAEACRLNGRWRIFEADLCNRAYLDLCGPATLTITAQGGEIAFRAMKASLDVVYARDTIDFHWCGSDEGDQVEGEGSAELLEDGTLEIEFPTTMATRLFPKLNGRCLEHSTRASTWTAIIN